MPGVAVDIRRARVPEDLPAIQAVNQQAFNRQGIGVFEKLLAANDGVTALVALRDGAIVGDVIFTPAILDSAADPIHGMGLGELGVLPAHQRQGVGTQLVNAGLDILRTAACPFVIVVGHASYYPRFGFVPGSSRGLHCQWDKVTDETFMVLQLDSAVMRGATGIARFRDIP
jgi:putative acetyltransferase